MEACSFSPDSPGPQDTWAPELSPHTPTDGLTGLTPPFLLVNFYPWSLLSCLQASNISIWARGPIPHLC